MKQWLKQGDNVEPMRNGTLLRDGVCAPCFVRCIGPALLGLLLALSSFAAERYPPDVAGYIEQRELCEHFRQEPWPEGGSLENQQRRAFITAQFERYCRGSDLALQALRQKYESDQAVMERLGKYERYIEGP